MSPYRFSVIGIKAEGDPKTPKYAPFLQKFVKSDTENNPPQMTKKLLNTALFVYYYNH